MVPSNVRFQKLSPAAQYGAIANRGQAGGISSISPQARKAALDNIQRSKFFKGRDVGEDRLRRRIKQDTLDKQFIDKFTKPVVGSSNLLQMTDDAPRSLAAERERLANIYGPTPSEIAGDIGFGLSRIAEGFAQKGTPLFQVVTGLGQKAKSGVEQLWDRVRGETPEQVGTAFPQPGSDAKDLFSSIDTGIAEVDPNNLLVQIAMANQGRFDDKPAFEDQLANATAMDFNTLLPQPIQNLQNKVSNLGNTKFGQFGLDNVLSLQPTATFNTNVLGGELGLTANPFKNQYGFQFTKAFNKGGSVNKNSGLGYMLK
jgi:hypothetical protein